MGQSPRVSEPKIKMASSEFGTPAWPKKTREFFNHHIDSSMWNDFDFRDGDIIISTYAKVNWKRYFTA